MSIRQSIPDSGLVLGIDASNLCNGGGLTHLIEFLHHAHPHQHGFSLVVVWGSNSTLALLPNSKWLVKRCISALEPGLIRRILWQWWSLSTQARLHGCHLLFLPGGSFAGCFHPFVTMSRNMLPFEWRELSRYGFSLITLRLIVLRWFQSNSFKNADGVIFLTNYAAQIVQKATGQLSGLTHIIPHGLNVRFCFQPKPQRAITAYSTSSPYRLLYVSIIDQYKHQWHVIEAVAELRRITGWPLTLDLVGSAYPPSLRRLRKAIDVHDPISQWVSYHGTVLYAKLHSIYQKADLGIFASSCENMPNILIETLAAGVPVASSKCGPMPEILGDAGVYFNPTHSGDIYTALERLIANPSLRSELAVKSSFKAQQYSWEACADQTFAFLAKVYQNWSEH